MTGLMDESYDKSYDLELSENESAVLHALIKWPNLSDQSVHLNIKMKKSTFSSIKTRLSDQNYFKRIYVPNFPKLGFELLIAMHGKLNRFSTFEERMRIAGDLVSSFTEDFSAIAEDNQSFNMSVAIKYTDYLRNSEKFIELYMLNNFLSKEGMNFTIFPFELSRIYSFLDYEALVAKVFNITDDNYDNRKIIDTGSTKVVKLTRAERKVLSGLTKYPEESDTTISKQIAVSRNTVANAKRKFLKKNICFMRVVPDLDKLGMTTLNFTYRKFNTKLKEKERIEAVNTVRSLFAPHFYISNKIEGIFVSAHKSMDEYKAANDELMDYYHKKDYVVEEPKSYQYNINSTKTIKENHFLPMILKLYNLDESFNYLD